MTDDIESRRADASADYEKDFTALKLALDGAQFHGAIKALHFSREMHPGYRKDGITPAHHHQVRIAWTVYDDRAALEKAGIHVNVMIGILLMHDVPEDNQALARATIEKHFGRTKGAKAIIDGAYALSKIRDGKEIPAAEYYRGLLENPMYMLAKLYDRRDNVQTILELPVAKQVAYVHETEKLLDISKEMRKLHPEVENITRSCRRQIQRALQMYLHFASLVKYGYGMEIVDALDAAKLLTRPITRKLPPTALVA